MFELTKSSDWVNILQVFYTTRSNQLVVITTHLIRKNKYITTRTNRCYEKLNWLIILFVYNLKCFWIGKDKILPKKDHNLSSKSSLDKKWINLTTNWAWFKNLINL